MHTNVLAVYSYFVTARELLFTHALYQEDPLGYYKIPFAHSFTTFHGDHSSCKILYAHVYILSARESSIATKFCWCTWLHPLSQDELPNYKVLFMYRYMAAKESFLATGYTVYTHGYILSAKESFLATGYTVYFLFLFLFFFHIINLLCPDIRASM